MCAGLALALFFMFSPKKTDDVLKANKILLTSPNGKFYITIAATDKGARINLGGDDTGDIFLSSGPGSGVSVSLHGKSDMHSTTTTHKNRLIMLSSNDFSDEITLGGIGGDLAILRLANKNDNPSEHPTSTIQFFDSDGNIQKEMTGL